MQVVSSPPSPILAQDQLCGRLHLGRKLPRGCSSRKRAPSSGTFSPPFGSPSRGAKLGSFECSLPLISPSPGSRCLCFPRSFHREQPVPAGWRFAPLSVLPDHAVQERPPGSAGKAWTRGLSPRGAFVTSPNPATPVVSLRSWAGPSKGAYGQRLGSRLRPSPAQRLPGPAVESSRGGGGSSTSLSRPILDAFLHFHQVVPQGALSCCQRSPRPSPN